MKKSFTTKDESKLLTNHGLHPNTSDFYYRGDDLRYPDLKEPFPDAFWTEYDWLPIHKPCWSLGRLLELLSEHGKIELEISKDNNRLLYKQEDENGELQIVFSVDGESVMECVIKTVLLYLEKEKDI